MQVLLEARISFEQSLPVQRAKLSKFSNQRENLILNLNFQLELLNLGDHKRSRKPLFRLLKPLPSGAQVCFRQG